MTKAGQYLRLRQIALVASDLSAVEQSIIATLGAPICYRDTGVAKYGLHNALFAFGGTFLEVVSPMQDDTAAGRYLERRGGDGGYMFIADCNDLEVRRDHFKTLGIRIVQDLKSGDDVSTSEGIHLHPRDTGGTLLSVDRHSGGADLMGGYHWAGPSWQQHATSSRVNQIVGARMQCEDPAAVARGWARIFDRSLAQREDGDYQLDLDVGFARFGAPRDERGDGLEAVYLDGDVDAVRAAANEAGVPSEADSISLGGTRFIVV
ncbi:MAG: hypothetical protein ABI206_05920 [Antricoccus sp.]